MMHKSIKISFLLILTGVLTLTSCGTSRDFTSEEFQDLEAILQDRYFKIEAEFARPFVTNALAQIGNSSLFAPGDNASQINITGDSNYLKFEGDTVSADLPYFGERQMGGGYSDDDGIVFIGQPKDLETIKAKDENKYIIRFDIQKETESFQIRLTFYPNHKATIHVTSSHRNQISYRGNLEDVELSEK
ncbi:DUF4251 domain-containing protein [Psychroflexus sp. YR1-1]|uniref:DUF4251 domain-containing protein n=1 Tax=Psychroflexus aurantiacus TaxID=2709310 RepID=A0A6B3R150_9FLAO|nr:DUF4251 domain-containing protein [Psychroflexus aurantiacus]NEV94356.1 DUF4251 domain-containing protein [Psychroflexus aurantiacus]